MELVRELKYAAGYGTSPDNPNSISEQMTPLEGS